MFSGIKRFFKKIGGMFRKLPRVTVVVFSEKEFRENFVNPVGLLKEREPVQSPMVPQVLMAKKPEPDESKVIKFYARSSGSYNGFLFQRDENGRPVCHACGEAVSRMKSMGRYKSGFISENPSDIPVEGIGSSFRGKVPIYYE